MMHPHGSFLKLAWEIALKHRQTFYDSLNLAVAMGQKAFMVTADRKFFDALAGIFKISDTEARCLMIRRRDCLVAQNGRIRTPLED